MSMKNLFKNPKTRLRNLLLVILPFVILAIVCGSISFTTVKGLVNNASGTNTTVYKDSIDSMDYHLRDNATNLQEDLFKDLQDAVKDGTDNANIALLVCKNYVADFYTWTNKVATYDVGGMYYVYSPQRTTIYQQSRNTYYKYLTYYIDTFGQNNLLEVESFNDDECSVSSSGTYDIGKKSYESYFVTIDWNYKNLETFNGISKPTIDGEDSGFVSRLYFTVIINEEGRFEIVEAYGDI